MNCTLMHKNIPVIDMEMLPDTGRIVCLFNPQNPEHLQLGVKTEEGVSLKIMDEWWTGRSIPASRDGIREALETLGIYSTTLLIDKCYGLSLSDQYWICPKDSGLRWEAINFFDNDFSKDIGEILFGHEPADPANISLMAPDNTSDGWLRKKWIIVDGKRILMKGGSGFTQQEPFNEVIASAVMRRLNIPHVAYTLTIEGEKPYSLCENFVTPDTELVPARRVRDSFKQDGRHSKLTHLLRCCENFGIPDIRAMLDKMIALDYIIANEDRHWNNFGFIRNAETLEWLGFAPIFDNGTSLWHNTPHVGQDTGCKTFCDTHAGQLKLVEDLSWFDADALFGLSDEIMEIFATSDRVDERRRVSIASAVIDRCDDVTRLRRTRK